SNSRRPATIAPHPDVSSRSIGALPASTEKLMPCCALGTTTSPFQYQSNSSAGLSSGWATKPSSDMHMWVSTLVIPDTTRLAPPTHRPVVHIRPQAQVELRHPTQGRGAHTGGSDRQGRAGTTGAAK